MTDWTARDEWNFWRNGLTWGGKCAWIAYRVRSWFIKPADTEARCFMGSPVGDSVWCPRYALSDSVWCRKHVRVSQTETRRRET